MDTILIALTSQHMLDPPEQQIKSRYAQSRPIVFGDYGGLHIEANEREGLRAMTSPTDQDEPDMLYSFQRKDLIRLVI